MHRKRRPKNTEHKLLRYVGNKKQNVFFSFHLSEHRYETDFAFALETSLVTSNFHLTYDSLSFYSFSFANEIEKNVSGLYKVDLRGQ